MNHPTPLVLLAALLVMAVSDAHSAPSCAAPKGLESASPTDVGVHWAQQGRFDDALPCFEEAAQADPGVTSWVNLGSLHHDLARVRIEADDARWRTHTEASMAAFDKALAVPAHPEQIVPLQGGNLSTLGRHADAKALMQGRLGGLTLPAVRADVVDRLGRLAQHPPPEGPVAEAYGARFGAASRVLMPLIDLKDRPADPLSPTERAATRRAVADLLAALKMHPRGWPAWWFVGMGKGLLGDLEGARTALARAHALHPAQPDVARELVMAHLRLGDAKGAAASDAIVLLHPQNAELVSNHALVLLMRGDAKGARVWVDRALALTPGDPITTNLAKLIDDVAAGRAEAPKRMPPPGR